MTKTAENIGGREGGLDGGNNVDRLTDIGKRTGVKDGEIETFITKVDAVNAAIQAMKVSYRSSPSRETATRTVKCERRTG